MHNTMLRNARLKWKTINHFDLQDLENNTFATAYAETTKLARIKKKWLK